MRLTEKLTDSGGRLERGEAPQIYLPEKVASVPPEVLKNFSHTKRVGNYLLGRTLGEGSFAKVKEGLHSLTGEKVAVKVIDKKKAKEDAYVRKNLRREGKLLQMIRHKHVVQLFEVMETENSYYLVTELCKGGDLMEHICNKKRLDERETRKYVRQILSAMDYLHKAGILHRDLKVENLLLDENKDVKIIDFGLSNAVEVTRGSDGITKFHEFCVTQCGSPAYAAPELLGNNKYGPSVDIWSIGINMYAMLTGSLPFTVEPFNIKALHKKMQKGDINTIPDHLSPHCKDLVKRFLNPDPDRRITIKEAMRHPWICEAYKCHVDISSFPNRLTKEDLVDNIVKHMCQQSDLKTSEVVRLVTGNIPNSATATYFLLAQRLMRYEAEIELQMRIQRAMKIGHHPIQDATFDLTGNDVIELTRIRDREAESGRTNGQRHHPRSQEPKIIERKLSPRKLPEEPNGRRHYRNTKYHPEVIKTTRRDVSPRRDFTQRRPRRGSMDHSPKHSPRGSPRGSPRRGKAGGNRRGSLEPGGGGNIRRGSLMPRTLSQETDGSSVAPSDIVLPDLTDPDVDDAPSSQNDIEGVKTQANQAQRPSLFRPRPGPHPSNLPALNAFTSKPGPDRGPTTTSPGPHHPKPITTQLNPPREAEKYQNKENGRLSPATVNHGALSPSAVNYGRVSPIPTRHRRLLPTSPTGNGRLSPSPMSYGRLSPGPTNHRRLLPNPTSHGRLLLSPTNNGRLSPGPTNNGRLSPGPMNNGRLSPGPINNGRLSPGPINNGRLSPGPMNNGRLSPGPINNGRLSPGPINNGRLSPSPTNNGRLSPGPTNNGRLSPGLTNNGRLSPGPMNNGRLSPSLITAHYRSNDLNHRHVQNSSSYSMASSVGRGGAGGSNNTVGGFSHPNGPHPNREWKNMKPLNKGNQGNLALNNVNDHGDTIANKTLQSDAIAGKTPQSDTIATKIPETVGNKKVLIDTGQYDRYARARIRPIGPPQPPHLDPDNPYHHGGQKKLINLMYPTPTDRKRQQQKSNNDTSAFNHHYGGMTERDIYLGVATERLSSGGRVGSGRKRQGRQQLSPGLFYPEEGGGGGGRERGSSASRGGSRSPSPSYFNKNGGSHDKVALPEISPTFGLGSHSGRIQIEDLDRQ